MSNPLLEKFTNTYGARPFDKIKNEHYMPAIKEAIKMHKEEIDAIKNFDGELNFANIIEKYATSGGAIEDISMIFFNLKSANTSDEMNEIAKEFSPLLTSHGNDVSLDADLFAKVKIVFDNKDNLIFSGNSLWSNEYSKSPKDHMDFIKKLHSVLDVENNYSA